MMGGLPFKYSLLISLTVPGLSGSNVRFFFSAFFLLSYMLFCLS